MIKKRIAQQAFNLTKNCVNLLSVNSLVLPVLLASILTLVDLEFMDLIESDGVSSRILGGKWVSGLIVGYFPTTFF